ncbi:MAG: alpha/beta hydrolase [Pirellulales bacterium]
MQCAALLWVGLFAVCSTASADSPSPAPRYWLVRTYGLSDPGADATALQHLDIQRLHDSRWIPESLEALASATTERSTIVYVHGNRGSDAEAIAQGTRLGAVLAARPDARPLQIIIWSWPSGQILRGRRDFVFKAERTDTEAWYLAALLRQFAPQTEISLLGYSYGARVVTGALHWRAGGQFDGRALPGGEAGARYRVALLAPAVNVDWLAPEGCHGDLWSATDRMLVLYNPCDPALRWYKFLYRRQRPTPLGLYGIDDAWLGEAAEQMDQWDVSTAIGRTHDENAYFDSPWIADQIGSTLLRPAKSTP